MVALFDTCEIVKKCISTTINMVPCLEKRPPAESCSLRVNGTVEGSVSEIRCGTGVAVTPVTTAVVKPQPSGDV